MMWQLTLLSLAALGSSGDTIFMEARHFEERVIRASGETPYQVWFWLQEGSDVGFALDVDARVLNLELAETASPDATYAWSHSGPVTLASGDWQVKADTGAALAGIWLSRVTDFTPQAWMQDRRVEAQPVAVQDQRSQTVKHTDTVFTMSEYASLEAWEAQAETIRRRIMLSSGLYHLPEDTPLNLHVFDRVEYDDYSIEKLHFEAYPGFLVTGNLYRPVGKTGPFPGVVSPHGHWSEGRLENNENCSVPARGITMARMGMVLFAYDMVGYNDSQQFVHREVSDQEKLWGLHPFALQLLMGIRAIDMMESLPDVDPRRIGVTGASGGGTQTFALMAVDPRVAVAAPVNMISSTMQGGCVCENAPLLRLNNSNMEVGGMMAPRPLLLVSATGDWTRETPRVEYPAIRSIYDLYGAGDMLEQVQVDAGHNYNQASREAVYRFFGKHLLPEQDWSDFTEPDYEMPPVEQLLLFPNGMPVEYPDNEAVVQRWLTDRALIVDKLLAQETTPAAWMSLRGEDVSMRQAFQDILGLDFPHPNSLAPERLGHDMREDHVVERWILRHPDSGAAIPALFYRSHGEELQDLVLLVHGDGKAALAGADGGPGAVVQGYLDAGVAVLCIDPYLVGEQHSPLQATTPVRVGAFHDTFHPTDTARQVQDIVTAASFLELRRDIRGIRGVEGFGKAGVWALIAGVLDDRIPRAVADMQHFAHEDDAAWLANYYIPGIRALGGLKALSKMAAPDSLLLYNVPENDDYPIAVQYSDTLEDDQERRAFLLH